MTDILTVGVILAFFFCGISLLFLLLKTFSLCKTDFHSEARGSAVKGIFYALGRGLFPWEKESAKHHLPTYVAGIFYHLGIFAALFHTASLILEFELNAGVVVAVKFFIGLGLTAGLGLLMKRILVSYMRKLSCPDDFAANVLVDLFLGMSLANFFVPELKTILMITTIILLVYIPLGKIRHCVFFFYSRILFGHFFGRRGVLPKKQSRIEG